MSCSFYECLDCGRMFGSQDDIDNHQDGMKCVPSIPCRDCLRRVPMSTFKTHLCYTRFLLSDS